MNYDGHIGLIIDAARNVVASPSNEYGLERLANLLKEYDRDRRTENIRSLAKMTQKPAPPMSHLQDAMYRQQFSGSPFSYPFI